MPSPASLASRVVAILVSHRVNAPVYATRGCEELDLRFRDLRRILWKARLDVAEREPAELYSRVTATVQSDAKFAAGLDALVNGDFRSEFGKIVTRVLQNWDSLPPEQLEPAEESAKWIGRAAEGWPPEMRAELDTELRRTARELYLFTNLWFLRRMARLLDEKLMPAAGDFPALSFSAVLDEELDEIEKRRRVSSASASAGQPDAAKPSTMNPYERATDAGLVGLAFSGGGIRSATFNLGVLQFLGETRILKRFDYLSTVSGGGYIGSWLHAWIHRQDDQHSRKPGIECVEEGLSPKDVPDPQDPRAAPIRFLRRYSNYLTPQTGFLSADTWTMINIWLRNTFLNLVIVVFALSSLLLIPRCLACLISILDDFEQTDYWLALVVIPACLIGVNLASFDTGLKRSGLKAWLCRQPAILGLIVIPVFLGAWGAGTAMSNDLKRFKEMKLETKSEARKLEELNAQYETYAQAAGQNKAGPEKERASQELASLRERRRMARQELQEQQQKKFKWTGESDEAIIGKAAADFAVQLALLVFLVGVFGRLDRCFYPSNQPKPRFLPGPLAYLRALGICVVASVASGILFYYFWLALTHRVEKLGSWQITTLSPPIFLFLLSLAVFLCIGLLGRRFADDRREWMARLGGWLAICCIGWVGLCGTALYGPFIIAGIAASTHNYLSSGGLSLAWVATTAAGLFSSRSRQTSGQPARGTQGKGWLNLVERAAPPIFVAGLLFLLAFGLFEMLLSKPLKPRDVVQYYKERQNDLQTPARRIGSQDTSAFEYYRSEYWKQEPVRQSAEALGLSILFGLLAFLLSRRVDINEFSLNPFYRNRLVRCYLGASRAARKANPFTGFDPLDDIRLTALAPSAGYSGPYPIINATLNLVHGDELAWQERKGEAFVFTPKFCGFDVHRGLATHARSAGDLKLSFGGYRPTPDYAYPNISDTTEHRIASGVRVGTAISISGAAASPNMGANTSGATAFLLTVFNLRLGWWLGNPRRTDAWRRAGPHTGLFELLAELTAQTSDTGKYIYLSDGGHFENMGIYELVRRRCRCIVLCDAEQDGDYKFGGLGNAIRKCRTDFGVEIDIDTEPLRPAGPAQRSERHYAVGAIRYPDPLPGGSTGVLIYIKSSLTGDEPADVKEYDARTPEFPHESTADQWFDESQFESYRKLGYHAAASSPLAEVKDGPDPFAPLRDRLSSPQQTEA